MQTIWTNFLHRPSKQEIFPFPACCSKPKDRKKSHTNMPPPLEGAFTQHICYDKNSYEDLLHEHWNWTSLLTKHPSLCECIHNFVTHLTAIQHYSSLLPIQYKCTHQPSPLALPTTMRQRGKVPIFSNHLVSWGEKSGLAWVTDAAASTWKHASKRAALYVKEGMAWMAAAYLNSPLPCHSKPMDGSWARPDFILF